MSFFQGKTKRSKWFKVTNRSVPMELLISLLNINEDQFYSMSNAVFVIFFHKASIATLFTAKTVFFALFALFFFKYIQVVSAIVGICGNCAKCSFIFLGSVWNWRSIVDCTKCIQRRFCLCMRSEQAIKFKSRDHVWKKRPCRYLYLYCMRATNRDTVRRMNWIFFNGLSVLIIFTCESGQ